MLLTALPVSVTDLNVFYAANTVTLLDAAENGCQIGESWLGPYQNFFRGDLWFAVMSLA